MKIGVSTSSFSSSNPAPLERLRAAGVEYVPNPFGRRLTKPEAMEFVAPLDGLVAGLEPLDRDVLSGGSHLRAVARVGIGISNVDLDAARDLGIRVSNTPAPPTDAVAELTMTAMLALIREFPQATQALRVGEWRKQVTGSLSGATVTIIGLGRIGRRVAELAGVFGARVLGVDPFLRAEAVPDGVTLVDLETGLAEGHVVSVHASGVDPILGSTELGRMQSGSILLNPSRGELVDESALGRALDEGRLAGAWFDAFWEEPYTGPLAGHDRFWGTPHVGTYTAPCRLDMEMEAVENVLRDLGVTEDA